MKITLSSVLTRSLWTAKDILGSKPITKLLDSGIITEDEQISNVIAAFGGGASVSIPYIKRPVFSEAAIGNDSDTAITPTGLSEVEVKAWIGFFNKAFTEKDIVKYVGISPDPISKVQDFFGEFWSQQIQNQLVNTLIGCIKANKADNAGDNILKESAKQFNYDTLVDALVLAGERMDEFDLLIMHPKTKAVIKKANKELFKIVDFENGAKYELYDGKQVIVSDLCPVDPTDGVTTFIVKRGAFLFAPANVEFPIEEQRDAKSGNGSGETTIISRMGYMLHPNGYSYIKGQQASVSPTLAELADAKNWKRVVEKEQAPFLAIQTKA
mgnify:FL=1|jgi:hypothetical protein